VYARKVFKTVVASLALASLSVTAWAAGVGGTNDLAALKSLSLEDLAAVQVDTVVGASKHEQKVAEAPSAVSIVTADGRQFRFKLTYKF
jgi:outer membrane receptor for ferrienterochelin and colicin